jgi:acetyl-CoA acetyltransferase
LPQVGTPAGVPGYELLAGLLTELTARGVDADAVQDVIAGVSTVHGEQAADVPWMAIMAVGWPDAVPGGMVSRMCTSGLDALAAGAAQVMSGMVDVVVAGGVAGGHPLGASGGILLANALELLGRRGGRYGLLVIPAALGVSMALVVERLG